MPNRKVKKTSLRRRAVKKLCRAGVKVGGLLALVYAGKVAVDNAKELKAVGKEEWQERKQREMKRTWRRRGINWGLGHVGVTVSNFERSVQWYDRVFGLKLMNYLELTGDDLIPVQRLYHVEGLKMVKLGFMASRSGNLLEVFEFDPPLRTEERETWNRPGYNHIAFHVSNVLGWVNRLRGEGVEFMNEPISAGGADWAFFRDPDGNLIELIDLHAARFGLGRLGALIGTVMKHTMMKDYYRKD